MKITFIPETEEEKKRAPKTVILGVVEYGLGGTRVQDGLPVPIRQAHVWNRQMPFDLVEKLECLKAHLIINACRHDKAESRVAVQPGS